MKYALQLAVALLIATALSACDGLSDRLPTNEGTPPAEGDDSPGNGGNDPGGDNDDEDEGDPGNGNGGGDPDDEDSEDPADDEDNGDDDTDGAGGLMACFNPANGVIGTRIELEYRATGDAGELTFASDILINRETTFNGHTVLESVAQTVSDGPAPAGSSTSTSTTLFTLDAAQGRQRTFRVVTEADTPAGALVTTTTFDPYWESLFDLDTGDSAMTDYTVTAEVMGGIFPIPAAQAEVARTRTYTGREPVTVPAGTFETCRVEEEVFDTVNGETTEEHNVFWYHVGSGVVVKETGNSGGGTTTTELLSGSIDGVPLP